MPLISLRSHGWNALLLLALAGCGGNSQYQGLDAEALFLTAQMEFEEGEWDNTIEALDRLIVGFQSFDRLPEGRFLLAQAYFAKEEYVTARAEFQRFIDRYVGHPLSPAAALGQCQSLAALAPHPQRDQTFTLEAITTCGNVIIDYAGTPESLAADPIRRGLLTTMAEKEYLNARHYLRRKQYDPAIIYFEIVVDRYPQTEFAPLSLLGIYRSNAAIGYQDLADEARDRLLNEYPESGSAAEIRLNRSEF